MAAAIRYVAATKKTPTGTLYLQCHVKPGASKTREGVAAVTDDAVEICVSAQAREGEANKAVIDVLCKALGAPKSSIQVTRGGKSRDKTVAVTGISSTDDAGGALLERVHRQLASAAE